MELGQNTDLQLNLPLSPPTCEEGTSAGLCALQKSLSSPLRYTTYIFITRYVALTYTYCISPWITASDILRLISQ